MFNIQKHWQYLFFTIYFGGCFDAAAATKPFIENFEVVSALTYQLIEDRYEAERTPSKVSLNRQSCEYGILRIGEDEVIPSRLDYLKSRLQRELMPELLNGSTVKVSEFSIYFNYQLSARLALGGVHIQRGGDAQSQEAIAGLLKSFECWADPTMPGGYNLESNPAAQPAAVVTIRLTVGGKPFQSSYTFIPRKDEQNLPVGGTALIRAVDALIANINGKK
jgi:hypothetical protein